MKTKSRLSYTILVILLFFTIYYFWYTSPIEVSKVYEGILYQLGSENSDVEEKVEIKLVGEVKRKLFSNIKFSGNIQIDSEMIPPAHAKEDKIQFEIGNNHVNGSPITYIDLAADGVSKFGNIYITNDLNTFVITVYAQTEDGGSSWNSKDGKVIAAPATSREEALEVTNELMNPTSMNIDNFE